MKTDAIQYEYLIRRANQCSRFEIAAANADVYRQFERSAQTYQLEPDEKTFREYMIKTGEITAHVKSAIYLVKKKYSDLLLDMQYQKLEEIELLLSWPDYEKINRAILISDKILLDIGLLPG